MNGEAVDSTEALQARLGYRFTDSSHLERALTHRSYANEVSPGTFGADNERLEFLGDAVLDLVLSDLLMKRFPVDTEGGLSKKRASLVNEDSLAGIAVELGLENLIKVGRGEARNGGSRKPRILASTLEAVFGAIFSDGGYQAVAPVIEAAFRSRIEEVGNAGIDYQADFKTRLQERAQELYRETPTYKVEGEFGPDHDKVFEISVSIGDKRLAVGRGRSKKAAEQDAARQALERLA